MPGIFFREQAIALNEAGHRVAVITPPARLTYSDLRNGESIRDFRSGRWAEEDEGVLTLRQGFILWPPGRLLRGWNDRFRLGAWENSVENYIHSNGTPDIIHSHSILDAGYVSARIRSKRKTPVVLTEHASKFLSRDLLNWELERARFTLTNIDKCLAVGPSLAERLKTFAPNIKVEVLGNLIDTEFFTLAESGRLPEEFTFTVVCTLVPIKGIDLLLQAFSKAFLDSRVKLCIAGDGSEREKLETMAHDLGLTQQVQFLGALDKEQIRDLIHASHVVVSSSHIETFGISLVEAMSCGKPVIATRSGGPESFIHDQNGVLVPVGDFEAIAVAMERMMKAYDDFKPERIREECLSRFSRKVIVQELENIYAMILNKI